MLEGMTVFMQAENEIANNNIITRIALPANNRLLLIICARVKSREFDKHGIMTEP
jgi:hypothetical protein